MGIQAGLLTEIITIKKRELQITSFGSQKETWNKAFETRAQIQHHSASKSISENELVSHYNKTFYVRFYVPVGNTDRIVWHDQEYQVISIEPDHVLQQKVIYTELVNK